MPAAAVAAVAVGSAVAQGVAGRKAAKKQNQYATDAANRYAPGSVLGNARQFNPWLYGALEGDKGTSGYQQNLYNIAQNPGYIDPSLMNAPYLQSAQRQQSDLAQAQGMLGRNALGGGTGLGSAYALANVAARTGRDTQIGQQYALWREQQRRADLDWLAGQQQQSIQSGLQSAGGQAQMLAQRQAPTPWLGVAGNAVSSGLTAYGAAKGMAGPSPAPQQPPMGMTNPQWWQRPTSTAVPY